MKTPLVVGVEAPTYKLMKLNLVNNMGIGCPHFVFHIAKVAVIIMEVCGNVSYLNVGLIDLLLSMQYFVI